MSTTIEAIYEKGVFKPLEPVMLQDGQKVDLSVEPHALTHDEALAQLKLWNAVYEGLSDDEVDEVERIALDRSGFFVSFSRIANLKLDDWTTT